MRYPKGAGVAGLAFVVMLAASANAQQRASQRAQPTAQPPQASQVTAYVIMTPSGPATCTTQRIGQ